jgi:hypothetical protein
VGLEKALQCLRLWVFLVRDTWPDLPGWVPVGLPPGPATEDMATLVASPTWRARPCLSVIPNGVIWPPGGPLAGTPVALLPWSVEAGLRAVAGTHQVPVLLPTCTSDDGPQVAAALGAALTNAREACRGLVVGRELQAVLDNTWNHIEAVVHDIDVATAGV